MEGRKMKRYILVILCIVLLLNIISQNATAIAIQYPYAYSTTTGINAVTLTHNVNLPTLGEANVGDFLLVCIDLNGNAGTITIPVNWTIIQKGINTLTFI